MNKKWLAVLVCLCTSFSLCACSNSSSKSDTSDTATTTTENTSTESDDPTEDMSMSVKNAYQSALDYLDETAFSKAGLIEQLSSEYGDGYPKEDATEAVEALEENGKVDWVEQAKISAQQYLDMTSFSKSELIEQLESDYGDKYTHEEAVEAVNAVYK